MAYFTCDQIGSYQDFNEIKQLWAATARPAGIENGEVWLDISETPLQLKRFNGTTDDVIGETAAAILGKIITVDGTGSGLDADLLDGAHASFFRNASNLNAGTVPSAQLSASAILALLLTVDGSGSGLDADLYRGKKIQFGTVTNAKDTGALVSFSEAFSSTPVVIAIAREQLDVWVTDISTTACKLRCNSTVNKYVDWIGIG